MILYLQGRNTKSDFVLYLYIALFLVEQKNNTFKINSFIRKNNTIWIIHWMCHHWANFAKDKNLILFVTALNLFAHKTSPKKRKIHRPTRNVCAGMSNHRQRQSWIDQFFYLDQKVNKYVYSRPKQHHLSWRNVNNYKFNQQQLKKYWGEKRREKQNAQNKKIRGGLIGDHECRMLIG